jgi:hypothetical protein
MGQDIGNDEQSGQFFEGTTSSGQKSGLYTIQASGSQIDVSVVGCLVWKYIMLAYLISHPSIISLLLGII